MSDNIIKEGKYVVGNPNTSFGDQRRATSFNVGDFVFSDYDQPADHDGDVLVRRYSDHKEGYISAESLTPADTKSLIASLRAQVDELEARLQAEEEAAKKIEVTHTGVYRVGDIGFLISDGLTHLFSGIDGSWLPVSKTNHPHLFDDVVEKIELASL
ncbi:hypothetical protein PBI_KATHERINEG_76 [Gordonia phage KatherineG]|uniref:Uncharacterized protein n=1 Tax=Gordonia phage KatherineG TaxID=1838070 RepID=A0A160DGQ4_9CAUD|nr:hypothetical protein BEN62_gp034 [Gordonia phage KatherineG]ANA87209.1 hypothetical protein PBI_KATHERINEG_76 [Gordonia phage KatherineG]